MRRRWLRRPELSRRQVLRPDRLTRRLRKRRIDQPQCCRSDDPQHPPEAPFGAVHLLFLGLNDEPHFADAGVLQQVQVSNGIVQCSPIVELASDEQA